MSQKVTAGRDNLGELAPQFAALNDDMLFGEVWAREAELSPRDRSLVTVSALIGAGILDSSLKAHLQKALDNGVTRSELVEVITQLGFYAGWLKAWAAFRLLKEILVEAE
jgi:4-carboxymuconolactone decarboxylase